VSLRVITKWHIGLLKYFKNSMQSGQCSLTKDMPETVEENHILHWRNKPEISRLAQGTKALGWAPIARPSPRAARPRPNIS